MMANMQAISGVEQLLGQLREAARLAGGPSTAQRTSLASGEGGFPAELARSLNRVSEVQNHANTQAAAFEAGMSDAPLSTVMIDLQKAALNFQATVQVRNRLVEAYKEIANMAI